MAKINQIKNGINKSDKIQKKELNKKTVNIIFDKDMFYNDLSTPMFVANKVYEIENTPAWVARWVKRGGVLVDDSAVAVAPVPQEVDSNKGQEENTDTESKEVSTEENKSEDEVVVEAEEADLSLELDIEK